MLSVVNNDEAGAEGRFGLDEICREGARTMLAAALEAEVDAYLAELVDERDDDGHRLVTRNGHARQRKVQTVAGAVEIEAPRVNDLSLIHICPISRLTTRLMVNMLKQAAITP